MVTRFERNSEVCRLSSAFVCIGLLKSLILIVLGGLLEREWIEAMDVRVQVSVNHVLQYSSSLSLRPWTVETGPGD